MDITPIILSKSIESEELLTREVADKKKNPRTAGKLQRQVPAVSHTRGTQKELL